MSTNYSADVFFGAFVARDSPLYDRLDEYIDRDGGCPAKTEVPGVEISMVGCRPTCQIWLVVQAVGSSDRFGKYDDAQAPRRLIEDPTWRPALECFLAQIGAESLTIGWYFAGSAG